MTNLTSSSPRTYYGEKGPGFFFPMSAAVAVYAGAALMPHTDGGLKNVAQSAQAFAGFADEDVDNSAGIVAAKVVRVIEKGRVWLTVGKATDFALTDLAATVYASDGNTFTLTSTNNAAIGKLIGFRDADLASIAAGDSHTSLEVLVDFEGAQCRSL